MNLFEVQINTTTLFAICCASISGAKAQEMRVVETSGNFEIAPLPIAAFFDTTITVTLSISGDPDESSNKEVLLALFQKLTHSVIPIGETTIGGTVTTAKSNKAEVELEIPVPTFEKPTQLVVKSQVKDTHISEEILFEAIPDDILSSLSESGIFITGANSVHTAFADRNLAVSKGNINHLKNGDPWQGFWFLQLNGDDRSNLSLPDFLFVDQFVVILEDIESHCSVPMAIKRGNGWVIHFPDYWFVDFSTNAGAQLAFNKTIKQITTK